MTTRITWRRVSETRITVSAKPAFDPGNSRFIPFYPGKRTLETSTAAKTVVLSSDQ